MIFKINSAMMSPLKTYHMSLITICLLKQMPHHDSFHWAIFGVPNSEGKLEMDFPNSNKIRQQSAVGQQLLHCIFICRHV